MTTPHVNELLGAYVLGALEPDEYDHVTEHLRSCATCRHEHQSIAAIPSLLAHVKPTNATSAPAGLESAVLAALHHEGRSNSARSPRRRRWQPILAAGLAGAGAAVAAFTLLGAPSRGPEQVVRLGSTSVPAATATADLRPVAGGTRVALTVDRLPPTRAAEVYEVWFVRPSGRVSAGTFRVTRQGRMQVDLTTAAAPTGYARIGITREPDGLDPARNGPNILSGPIPS